MSYDDVKETKDKNNNNRFICFYKKNLLNREDGPAVVQIDNRSNKILSLEWFINGVGHRDDGPQRIVYFDCRVENKQVEKIVEYKKEGMLDRDDGPAIIKYYDLFIHDISSFAVKEKIWYKKNQIHNEYGPGRILFSFNNKNEPTNIGYYKDNKKHKLDGPAYIDLNKKEKKWYVNDKLIDVCKYPVVENGYIINYKNVTKHNVIETALFDRDYGNFILEFLKNKSSCDG